MNDSKLKKLFEAARRDIPPQAPLGFASRVIAAIQRSEQKPLAPALLDQLGRLFPRLAWAAVLIIGLCVAAEVYLIEKEAPLSANVEQVAEHWLFAAK